MPLKPARVIIHRGYWYVKLYFPGEQDARKYPVGELADVPRPTDQEIQENPSLRFDWWRPNKKKGQSRPGSKHYEKIEATIAKAERERRAFVEGEPLSPKAISLSVLSLDKLHEQYLTDPKRILVEGELTKSKREKINSALKSIVKYDPKANSKSLESLKFIIGYREWGAGTEEKKGEYDAETFRTYVNNLKRISAWALERRIIRQAPILQIKTKKGSAKRVRHPSIEAQKKLFRRAWIEDCELCLQAMMERFSAYRMSDITKFSPEDINFVEMVIEGLNSKMGREQDDFPISKCIEWIFTMMKKLNLFYRHQPRLFAYPNTEVVSDRLADICQREGIEQITSHPLKRALAKEIQAATRGNPSLFNMLLHHKPKGMDQTGIIHYSGADLENMRMVLDNTQIPIWWDFLTELENTQPGFAKRDVRGRVIKTGVAQSPNQ